MIYTKELKDHVTTLEQSKKLIELGIDYETKFVYYIQLDNGNCSIRLRKNTENFFNVETYPAFLPNELWEIQMDLQNTPNGQSVSLVTHLVTYITKQKAAESGLNFN